MYCARCGKQLRPDGKFCENCGAPVVIPVIGPQTDEPRVSDNRLGRQESRLGITSAKSAGFKRPDPSEPMAFLLADKTCVPAFALGLIAGLLGIMGGYCMTACMAYSSSASNGSFFMVFIPSIVGLIGACLCYRKARLGSCLMLIPAITILIKGWFMTGGAEMMTIMAMILFWIASIVGYLMTR